MDVVQGNVDESRMRKPFRVHATQARNPNLSGFEQFDVHLVDR
jgi:hypothetical protein